MKFAAIYMALLNLQILSHQISEFLQPLPSYSGF